MSIVYDTPSSGVSGANDMVLRSLTINGCVDEYVWLAERPVALICSNLSATWARQADSAGACVRNGDGVGPPCGTYFPVNDVIGKPVLMLDAAGLVAGTGESDPFGHVTGSSSTRNRSIPTARPTASSRPSRSRAPQA